MKIKTPIYRLQVSKSPKRFIIDRKFAKDVNQFSWSFIPKLFRARATVRPKEPRVMLHKYVAELEGLKWVEIFFANNDPFDCRVRNLRPYRRDEEGARRKMFKNKRIKIKGVYLKKSTGKYGASLRHKRKLIHLGYFPTPELAAAAHRKAYNARHDLGIKV